MDHAVGALGIAAGPAVAFPVGLLHQLPEARRIPLVEQVAGPLPAEEVVGGRAPGAAFELPVAFQKLEEHRRLVEPPSARSPVEDPTEQGLALLPGQEVRLVGRLGIGVARGDHHPLDAQGHDLVEELPVAGRVGPGEERGVGGDAKSGPAGRPDRRHRPVIHALAADRVIVLLPRAVEVDREGEVGGGGEPGQHLLELEGVGAEVEIPLAGHDPGHDLLDPGMEQRLAPGDRDQRRAALVHGRQALLGGELRAEHLGGMLDLATAAAGEVAAKQGLEHQHQGIAAVAPQPLHGHVPEHRQHLADRNAHRAASARAAAARQRATSGKVIG